MWFYDDNNGENEGEDDVKGGDGKDGDEDDGDSDGGDDKVDGDDGDDGDGDDSAYDDGEGCDDSKEESYDHGLDGGDDDGDDSDDDDFFKCWVYFVFWWSSVYLGSPGGSDGKKSACHAGDLGSIPGSGKSPGKGNGHPLQHSCLENFMDRRAWRATVDGVTKSQTQLSS